MVENETPKQYQAYLVRIWSVKKTEGVIWHAFITNAHTSESRGFANLDELFDYLRQQAPQELESRDVYP
jgi:hypothetical protein